MALFAQKNICVKCRFLVTPIVFLTYRAIARKCRNNNQSVNGRISLVYNSFYVVLIRLVQQKYRALNIQTLCKQIHRNKMA